jgi:8-oxo-dGTP diphosphatase
MLKKTSRVSAYGLITDDQDRILLCRLSAIVEDAVGKWILPGGGIDFGEDPVAAVVREVKEETGLKVHYVGELLDVDSRVIQFTDREVHAIRIIYRATVLDGELAVEKTGGSTDACAWFTRAEVKELPLVHLTAKALEFWK